MAENNPMMPAGAVPPKPAEAAKIQPKKETVRINLPPKPTAAPTIKIPSPAAISAAAPAAAAPVAATAAPAAPTAHAAPAAAASPAKSIASAPTAPARPAAAPRPAVVSGVGKLDYALAFVAVAVAAAVLVRVFMLAS